MKILIILYLGLTSLTILAQKPDTGKMMGTSKREDPSITKEIKNGDLEALKKIISKENIDEQINPPIYQMTPLMTAFMEKKLDIVKFLVEEMNADIYRSYPGWDSLDWPWHFLTKDIADLEAQKVSSYMYPRYQFYKPFINKVLSASKYSVDKISWPNEKVRVFLIGENHGAKEVPSEVAKIIEKLPITHFATEFLSQSEQGLINDYQKKIISDNDFESRIDRKNIMPAYKAANKKGVSIIGLEKFPSRTGSPEDQAKVFITEERNKNWMIPLRNILKNDKNAKILIYCGSAHSDYFNTKKSLSIMIAEEFGKETVYVISITGGTRLYETGPLNYDPATYIVDMAGRRSEDIIMYLDKQDPEYLQKAFGNDAIVHIRGTSIFKANN